MKQISYLYKLTEEGRKNSLINGGNGKKEQVVYIDLDEKELEKVINLENCSVNEEGYVKFDFTRYKKYIVMEYNKTPKIHSVSEDLEYNKIMTFEELINNYKKILVNSQIKKEELKAELPKKIKEFEIKQKEEHDRLIEKQKIREDELKKEKEEIKLRKIEKQKEKEEWIEKNGSERLKKALKYEYDCEELYIEERSNIEIPGFEINEYTYYEKIKSPTLKQLEELERYLDKYEAEIVIIDTCEDYYPEAIIIYNYLNSGDYFIKILD